MAADPAITEARRLYAADEANAALTLARELVARRTDAAVPAAEAHARFLLADLLYLTDREIEARKEMEAALACARGTGEVTLELHILHLGAEMALRAGRSKDAHDYLYEIAHLATAEGEHAMAAAALRRHGELLALLGAEEPAIEALEWARDTFRRLGDAEQARLCEEQVFAVREGTAARMRMDLARDPNEGL